MPRQKGYIYKGSTSFQKVHLSIRQSSCIIHSIPVYLRQSPMEIPPKKNAHHYALDLPGREVETMYYIEVNNHGRCRAITLTNSVQTTNPLSHLLSVEPASPHSDPFFVRLNARRLEDEGEETEGDGKAGTRDLGGTTGGDGWGRGAWVAGNNGGG